jgi:hypothetical protein
VQIDERLGPRGPQAGQHLLREASLVRLEGREEAPVEIGAPRERPVAEGGMGERRAHRRDEDERVHRRPLARAITMHGAQAGGSLPCRSVERAHARAVAARHAQERRAAEELEERLGRGRHVAGRD